MPLIKCSACEAEMSTEAQACPKCGQPNKEAVKKEYIKQKDQGQKSGCLLILLSFFVSLMGIVFAPLLFVSGLIFVVGVIIILLNTRIS